MTQLKVLIVGTSPVETMRLEEVLQQTGCMSSFRYISLDQAFERVPSWDDCDLLIARYHEPAGPALLNLLAPVLRLAAPIVFFLIDPFEAGLVTRLMNAGGRRILPAVGFEPLLDPALHGVFGLALPRPPVPLAGHSPESQNNEGPAAFFRNSPVGICLIRQSDGLCLDCNESFARLLEWPRAELIGRDLPELAIPPEIAAASSKTGQNPGGDHSPGIQFERKIYTRTWQIRSVQVHVDWMEWAGETCLFALVQDITEREQAKEKIKRLNNELERLVLVRTGALEAANRELAAEIGRRKVLEDFSNQLSQILWETPDIVAIYAPDGQMQFLNKAGRTLFGLTEDESAAHLDLFSAYAPESRRWIRDEIQPQVLRQGIWRGEASFQLPDGRIIPISQVLLCQRDELGAVQFFAFIARDVSDFKYVEQELRKSRERYRMLAEAAHDFIFMVSKDGRMEYANEYACRSLGIDPDRVSGLPVTHFFPKDFAANHLRMFTEVHNLDRPIYTEGPFHQDGQDAAWLGTWLVPIHSEDGSLASILGISRDITEQKRTDEALQRALQNERKLGEMRSNFFSMTSHQFRTPLSTILLSVELLMKYGQKWEEPKRLEHLGRIQEAVKRLNSMLEDILVIGRVESGRYVSSPKQFDLIEFCDRIIHEMALNDHEDHLICFDHIQNHLPVYQDSEVMHRVIDNLLSNAIKYSPKGSQISIKIELEGQDVLVEVTDQGIGIPEQEIKYIFQPFQRGSNAADLPGTGIGLTIIQKSVELMNGSISLKSKEGQGTTFLVRFPVRYDQMVERLLI